MKTIADRFGGRRALLRTIEHTIRSVSGKYHKYRSIDWESVSRLVFVCKGNICRSAYAEALLKESLVPAISAGLSATPGNSADFKARNAGSRHGINLDSHRSKLFEPSILHPGDLIIAFEPAQAEKIEEIAENVDSIQITLLGLWNKNVRWPYIHDPYGLSDNYFNYCFLRIRASLNEVVRHITIHEVNRKSPEQ